MDCARRTGDCRGESEVLVSVGEIAEDISAEAHCFVLLESEAGSELCFGKPEKGDFAGSVERAGDLVMGLDMMEGIELSIEMEGSSVVLGFSDVS